MAELPSYTSLYRRFRPQRFSEVLGQEHVTRALRNAVSHDRVAHAYLFSGPRGTGKTSTARILAKALNCQAPVDGEPCCECNSCISITEGRSFDVVELDAASNSGVDAIRSLIAQTPTGTLGKWKVYIIDEVHMLTTGASNALLKTLEEPPSHVVFVLATTDPQKVIPTIKSRTQHYEFRFLDEATLERLINSVSAQAELNLDEEALGWLLSKGGGSARDTLSYLDQFVALGYVPESRGDLDQLVSLLRARDTKGAMAALDACLRSGQDPQRICVELISVFRSKFLENLDGTNPAGDSEAGYSSSWLVRALTVLGETLIEMKDSLDPRIILEVALVALINPESDPLVAELSRRVTALETEIALLKLREPSPSTQVREGEAARSGSNEFSGRPPEPTQPTQQASMNTASQQARGKISEKPSPSQVRSKDELARLKSVVSDAKSEGSPSGKADAAGGGDDASSESSSGIHGSPAVQQDAQGESEIDRPSKDQKDLPSDLAESNRVFKKEILPLLNPRARSLYAAARLVSVDPSRVVLSVPNEAHRSHAQANLGDVFKAFANYLSRDDLTVELTSDAKLGDVPQAMVPEVEMNADLIEQFSSAPEAEGRGVESEIFEIFPGAKKIEP